MTNGCCFNYWTEDPSAPHGVKNRTIATPLDDSLCACPHPRDGPFVRASLLQCSAFAVAVCRCHGFVWNTSPGWCLVVGTVSPDLADSFTRFIESRKGAPFLAQISFHNCHVRDRAMAARTWRTFCLSTYHLSEFCCRCRCRSLGHQTTASPVLQASPASHLSARRRLTPTLSSTSTAA